jgi:glyoxylase-like metal-dependent hydrolase (beta-lactamase superfamily II)
MQFGDHRIEIIPDTEFWLDGGAMFGIVPRVLWETVSPPDERNRVRLNMNCLFIETPTERILVETGIGEKWTPKEAEMYRIRRERPFAESLLAITGCSPSDISLVINTHLHFDHAGGNTIIDGRGTVVPQFPNARYFVSENEFAHSQHPHERDRASYREENWKAVEASGQLDLKPAEYEAVEGLYVEQVRGHSETMQTIRFSRGGKTLFGFYDMIPTRHHVAPAWIMSYDLFPTETLQFKKDILPQAAAESWDCLFYHDPDQPLGRITAKDGRFVSEAVAA